MNDLASVLNTLVVVGVVAALAPLIVALLPGPRVPQIVLLIIGGIVIGPEGFGLADPAVLILLANIGLGLVFLLAGYELDPAVFGERAGRLALVGWLITVALAAGLVGVLEAIGFVHAFVPVALGLTTTALGTLLPILRDHDLLAGRFGRYILAAGAVGELLPILGIAIFLGAHSQFVGILSLASVGVLAVILSLAPRLARGSRIERIFKEGEHSTSQTTLRFSIVLLLFLLAVAAQFGLDVVLGAFLAGMVLRRWATRRRPLARGEARRDRLRLLHPGLLHRIGDEPRRGLDRPGPAAAADFLRIAARHPRTAGTAGLPPGALDDAAATNDVHHRHGIATARRAGRDRAAERDHAARERGSSRRRRRIVGHCLPGGRRCDRDAENRPRAGRVHFSGAAERADCSRPDRRACRTDGRRVTRRRCGRRST